MSEALKLGGVDETLIFFRATGFYLVQGVLDVPLKQQAEDHAVLNPGTLRIEDVHGNVLWCLQ